MCQALYDVLYIYNLFNLINSKNVFCITPASCLWNSRAGTCMVRRGNMNMVIPYEPLLEEPITEYSSGKSESPLRSLRLQAAQMVQEWQWPPFCVWITWIFNNYFFFWSHLHLHRSHYSKVYTVKLNQIFHGTFSKGQTFCTKRKRKKNDWFLPRYAVPEMKDSYLYSRYTCR